MYYIGLDVHKKTISYWVKDGVSAWLMLLYDFFYWLETVDTRPKK